MKTDEEIFNDADTDIGNPFETKEGLRSLLLSNGHAYPFIGKRMLNPLDPVTLLLSIVEVDENTDDDRAMEWAYRICRTVHEAWRIRKSGYSIVTRYKSGAPRVVLDKVTNKVIILGELASSNRLILPILSTQLADNGYEQANVEAWKERGFTTPEKYDVRYRTSTWEDPDPGFGYNYKTRTLESWHFGGYGFYFIKEEAEVAEVSDDGDRDFDYEGVEHEYFRIEKDNAKETGGVPGKTERPQFIWQDKGVTDED